MLPYVVKGVGEAAHIEQLVVHNFDSPHHHIVDRTIDRGGIPNSVERTTIICWETSPVMDLSRSFSRPTHCFRQMFHKRELCHQK